VTKLIECQDEEALEKVRLHLENQFDFTNLGLSSEHMWICVGRILKSRWGGLLRIHKLSMLSTTCWGCVCANVV
jgi:hypothetical protein